ncbi:MAG: hypothetical protein H6965_13440 [Chromatiaceae bacterium]|nr:hypothetical protein [Chromatiaceae bacterium]
MKIDYLVFVPDSLTFTIASALTALGYSVAVWVANPKLGNNATDRALQRIAGLRGVKIERVGSMVTPTRIERLIIQVFPRLMEQSRMVAPMVRMAEKVTLVTAGDRSHRWRKALRLQWMELRELIKLHKVERVVYKDGFHAFDLFRFFKPRRVVGFDIHSQFLLDPSAFRKIHAQDWSTEAKRPISANFLGSRDPAVRERILDSVRLCFTQTEQTAGSGKKSMFWHEYSDSTPGGVGADEFLDILSKSDFTLCPPGYSLVTHRPLEALLRGSIPVLNADELAIYDIGLQDGKNCIAVQPGAWPAAMSRIQKIGEEQLIGMRSEIRSMFAHTLDYPACSRSICWRLGLKEIQQGRISS